MASEAISGFVTGFAGTLAQGILERKKEARDYFNKQVEFARTTGLENRNRVRQTVDASISVARQLEAVGVPKEIIMAQVNQNPAGLGDFYAQAEKLRASTGRDLTPDEWKSIFKVSGDFKAPDEDLATFISRTYDPIANAASAPEFSDDPEGSLIASMMGFSAMDEARARLAETDIGNGLTADELIRYGDTVPQRVGGSATVTTNYEALPEQGDDLSTTETLALSKQVSEDLALELDRAMTAGELSVGGDATAQRNKVINDISNLFPSISRSTIERLVDRNLTQMGFGVGMPAEEPEVPAEEVPEAPMGEGSPEPQQAPEEAPTASGEALSPEERMAAETGLGYSNIADNGDGTMSVTLPDGRVRTYRNSDVRKLLETQLGYRP